MRHLATFQHVPLFQEEKKTTVDTVRQSGVLSKEAGQDCPSKLNLVLGWQPQCSDLECRARLATDASQMYPLAIKYITCANHREYRVVKHEAGLMQATSQAGLSCVPQLYDVHWLDKAAAYLVMQ